MHEGRKGYSRLAICVQKSSDICYLTCMGCKKLSGSQKQHCKRAGATKRFDIMQVSSLNDTKVIVITQDEYDIFVITRVRGEAEDEC